MTGWQNVTKGLLAYTFLLAVEETDHNGIIPHRRGFLKCIDELVGVAGTSGGVTQYIFEDFALGYHQLIASARFAVRDCFSTVLVNLMFSKDMAEKGMTDRPAVGAAHGEVDGVRQRVKHLPRMLKGKV